MLYHLRQGLMLSCWMYESAKRPSFEQILNNLVAIFNNKMRLLVNSNCLPIFEDTFLLTDTSNVATAAAALQPASSGTALNKSSSSQNTTEQFSLCSSSPTESTFFSAINSSSMGSTTPLRPK